MKITGTDDPIPPSLDMLEAVNIRSGVEQSGTAAFSDLMLNQVQHNILWGQGDNLMMVPTDCDQRDERLGCALSCQVHPISISCLPWSHFTCVWIAV